MLYLADVVLCIRVLGRCFAKDAILKVVEAQRALMKQKSPLSDCGEGLAVLGKEYKGFLTTSSHPLKLTIRDYLKSKLMRLGR